MKGIASHPEPAVLAAFVEGNVDGKELTALTSHLIDCEECQGVVRAGAEFQRELGHDQKTAHPLSLRKWLIAAMLLLAVVAALPIYRWQTDPLRHVQGTSRRIEAQLTKIRYAPFQPARRSSSEMLPEALAHLWERVRTERSAGNLHRLALGELANGHVRTGHDLLVEALSLEPQNPEILSDLAAAQFGLHNVAEAAENSARALEIDRTLAPAAFNWALALQTLAIDSSATRAWRRYLELDTASEWANEARSRLEQLAPLPQWSDSVTRQIEAGTANIQAVVTRHPQQARKWIAGIVLPRWAAFGRQRDLEIAREIAAIRAEAGDPFLSDVVQHAERNVTPDLRRGLSVYGAASERLTKRDSETAREKYLAAGDLLRRAGSPLALSADISSASCDFYGGRSQAALARLERLLEPAPSPLDRYPGLAADAEWVRGLVLSRIDANESLEAYRRGLVAARRGREVEHETALLALIVEILDRVGEITEADRLRMESLRRIRETAASSDRRYNAFSSGAYAALRASRPRLALALIEAQSEIASETRDPLQLAESSTERALALRDVGRLAEASHELSVARSHAVHIPTEAMRDRTLSNLAFVAGTIELKSSPTSAITELTEAINTWGRYGWHVHTATAYLMRGEAHLAAGAQPAAEADFMAGIIEMEQQRDRLTEPRLRVAYFERADRLFSRLVELMLDAGRHDEALTIAERKRAHEILTSIAAKSTTDTRPLDAATLSTRLKPDCVVLEYMLLDRGAATWILTKDGRVFIQSSANRAVIERAIARLLAGIENDDAVSTAQSARLLYSQLLQPAERHLRGASRVVIVADETLQRIPFPALISPAGRYFIEDASIVFAPSSSTYVVGEQRHTRGTAVLAVAQPAPEGMETLTNAEREVLDIVDLYSSGRVFVGPQITAEEFLHRAGRAAVVHFAGHAQISRFAPSDSALLFEGSAGPTMRLRAATIASALLPDHPLVVLAGCRTGDGPLRQNEAQDSLATAFLRAGARGVVATLWDVDDDVTADFFQLFHAHLSAGGSAPDALRHAQTSFLQSPNQHHRKLRNWSAYALFGNS